MEIDYIDPKNFGLVHTVLSEEHQALCWSILKKNAPTEAVWEGNTLLSVPRKLKQWWITEDKDKFEREILAPLVSAYINKYGLPGKVETTHKQGLKFSRFWCRASTRHDYHALHDHRSIMTFVTWLHNPVNSEDEKRDQWGFRPEAGEVILTYNDTCGKLRKYIIPMSPQKNGKMMVFPSDINHMSQPIHSTDEYRICLAGDIAYDSYSIGEEEGVIT